MMLFFVYDVIFYFVGSVLMMGCLFNFIYLFVCVILFVVYVVFFEKENVDG